MGNADPAHRQENGAPVESWACPQQQQQPRVVQQITHARDNILCCDEARHTCETPKKSVGLCHRFWYYYYSGYPVKKTTLCDKPKQALLNYILLLLSVMGNM